MIINILLFLWFWILKGVFFITLYKYKILNIKVLIVQGVNIKACVNIFVFLYYSLNLDSRGFQTLWGSIIGCIFSLMSSWTVAQPIVQRVAAMRTMKDVKK